MYVNCVISGNDVNISNDPSTDPTNCVGKVKITMKRVLKNTKNKKRFIFQKKMFKPQRFSR